MRSSSFLFCFFLLWRPTGALNSWPFSTPPVILTRWFAMKTRLWKRKSVSTFSSFSSFDYESGNKPQRRRQFPILTSMASTQTTSVKLEIIKKERRNVHIPNGSGDGNGFPISAITHILAYRSSEPPPPSYTAGYIKYGGKIRAKLYANCGNRAAFIANFFRT